MVEGQLLILQDVTISTTALAGARGDARQDLTGSQLLNHLLLVHNRLLSLLELGNRRLALALHLRQIVLHHGTLGIDLAGVVLLEPGLERRGIDRHNATLHDRVRTHQLVVGSVVHNVQDLGLGGESYFLGSIAEITLTGPGEGTRIETDSTVLQVSTTAAHQVNTLRTELGHGRLATHLELSLLDVDHHLSTSQTTLMTRITANTYTPVTMVPIHSITYPLFTKSNTSEIELRIEEKAHSNSSHVQ